jgi:hypothetical protein
MKNKQNTMEHRHHRGSHNGDGITSHLPQAKEKMVRLKNQTKTELSTTFSGCGSSNHSTNSRAKLRNKKKHTSHFNRIIAKANKPL